MRIPDPLYFSDFLLESGLDWCDDCEQIDTQETILPVPEESGYPRYLCLSCRESGEWKAAT